ncbi:hypothetical protein HYX13_05465, partial [Candidatus Woesearchaeota archaeon]|nr:hypothetical protein [Candidatus Woesearchaeota archaeon]
VPAYFSLQHKYVGRKIPEDILGHAWDSFWSGGINGWLGISLAGEFFLNKVTGGNYDLPGWYIGASIAFAWPYLRAVSDLAFGNTFEKEKKELIERTERRLNST